MEVATRGRRRSSGGEVTPLLHLLLSFLPSFLPSANGRFVPFSLRGGKTLFFPPAWTTDHCTFPSVGSPHRTAKRHSLHRAFTMTGGGLCRRKRGPPDGRSIRGLWVELSFTAGRRRSWMFLSFFFFFSKGRRRSASVAYRVRKAQNTMTDQFAEAIYRTSAVSEHHD